jgi:trans-aconitate 2-methyltransferase
VSKDSWSPLQYDKFQAERSQPFFHLLALVAKKPEMSVIDLGCGTGELTQILHQTLEAHDTTGVDNSEAMLAKTELYVTAGLGFKKGTIETFNEKSKYDLVFSNAAIQWCQNHSQIFAAIRDSLKPNGQMAIQMPANHDYPTHVIAHSLAKEEPFRSALGKPRPEPMLDVSEYASLMYELGLKEPTARVNVYGHILDKREDVVEWVKGTMLTYYQSRLSPEMYDRFYKEYCSRLFKVLPNTKPFFYPFKRILLWGRLT